MTIDKSVGRKIKYLRKKKKITQTDLGVAVFNKSDSASQNTIKNIETGRRNTKPDELNGILSQLDITKLEFNDLNLQREKANSTTPEENPLFPEINYYTKLFNQAYNAGDEYMKLQIYKAMIKKLEEKISIQEALLNKTIEKTDANNDA